MATDEQRLESLAIEWIIRQVRARRRMKDTLPIEGAMTVPLEWAESLANVYAPMATDDTRPAYDDLAAIVREIGRGGWSREVGPGDETWPVCIFCDAPYEGEKTKHAPDCLVSRCKKLAALLDSNGLNVVE